MSAVPVTAEDLQDTLLQAWESLHACDALARPGALLQLVWPQPDPEQWQHASLGERDACLFLLQASLFGRQLRTVAACPACGERLESWFDADALCVFPSQVPGPGEPLDWECQGYRIRYRLPCAADLAAVLRGDDRAAVDAEAAAAHLLDRCVLEASRDGAMVAVAHLPPQLVDLLGTAMAERDPVAGLQFDIACPACAHRWPASLDIGAYVWDELDDWAQELLSEVDMLARHYAWAERDILAMTPVRRRFYLDLVRT